MTARRGLGRLGCLVTLLILVTAAYFAVNVGEVYLRFYRLRDAMEQEARFAAEHDDAAIKVRLAALADSLGLPEDATRIRVQRSAQRIIISTEYSEQVVLPMIVRDLRFAPRVERAF